MFLQDIWYISHRHIYHDAGQLVLELILTKSTRKALIPKEKIILEKKMIDEHTYKNYGQAIFKQNLRINYVTKYLFVNIRK